MVETERRNPDELLADVQREEARARRGRLRVFFGASAGVGKTYSMLEAARAARDGGADIVVGYVEPHGRVETERLLEGLEQLPFLEVHHRGIVRREFDLDAALRRAPAIVLVDELAHSNIAEGEPLPRHAKRWQDVEELLDAGISVWTTLNVQHLESLNDVVAGITGVRQQETLPDRVFDEADEVELIDLPPDDLLARLKAGKVYVSDQGVSATERFFRKPESTRVARAGAAPYGRPSRRGGARLSAAQERVSRPWLARDRFLIAVGPGRPGRTAGAHRQALCGCARRGVARGVGRDATAAQAVGKRTQPAHRCPAPRRVAGRRDRDARWSVGGRRAERLCAVCAMSHASWSVRRSARFARLAALSTTTELVRRGGLRRLRDRESRRAARRRDPKRPPPDPLGPYWAALLITLYCTGLAAGMYHISN